MCLIFFVNMQKILGVFGMKILIAFCSITGNNEDISEFVTDILDVKKIRRGFNKSTSNFLF